jgi:thioredoxin 1
VEELSAQDFRGAQLTRPGTYLVDFSASWCSFCRRFLPEFQAREGTIAANFAIGDVSDESSPLWEEFGIRVVPTLIAFREGVVVGRWDGKFMRGLSREHLDLAAAVLGSSSPAAGREASRPR